MGGKLTLFKKPPQPTEDGAYPLEHLRQLLSNGTFWMPLTIFYDMAPRLSRVESTQAPDGSDTRDTTN